MTEVQTTITGPGTRWCNDVAFAIDHRTRPGGCWICGGMVYPSDPSEPLYCASAHRCANCGTEFDTSRGSVFYCPRLGIDEHPEQLPRQSLPRGEYERLAAQRRPRR